MLSKKEKKELVDYMLDKYYSYLPSELDLILDVLREKGYKLVKDDK